MKYIIFGILIALLAGCREEPESSKDTKNDLSPYVLIPAGSFMMGNQGLSHSPGEVDDEIPVHSVAITKDFYMGRFEVSLDDWSQVYKNDLNKNLFHPVTEITWYDALEFCNQKSEMDGYKKCYTISGTNVQCDWTANGWRLPTEAEWEYACKAGTTDDFYNGNQTTYASLDPKLDEIAWYAKNSNYKYSNRAQKLPNAFGLYDMLGNVSEFCWDYFYDRYYYDSPFENPTGLYHVPPMGNFRVIRGGDFGSPSYYCRSSNRESYDPDTYSVSVGFRIVRNK